MPDMARFKLAVEHNEMSQKGKLVKRRRTEHYSHLDAARTRACFLVAMGYTVKITRGRKEFEIFTKE